MSPELNSQAWKEEKSALDTFSFFTKRSEGKPEEKDASNRHEQGFTQVDIEGGGCAEGPQNANTSAAIPFCPSSSN
jgi:hypothetical protein